ncbi:MAG: hypothetical protein ABIO50_09020 [Nitrosospira sp.]
MIEVIICKRDYFGAVASLRREAAHGFETPLRSSPNKPPALPVVIQFELLPPSILASTCKTILPI